MNNTVILANGSFPKHNLAIKILNEAETIICCDGSINNLDRLNIVPTQIIGDMDSISNELKVKYRSKLIEILDQDQNDLRKSINWLEQNNYKSAIILGATGSREDHSLGNIFTLLETLPPYWELGRQMMYEMIGNPETEKELLKAASPIFHVDSIKVPLFVAQGANDPRVKQSESDQIVKALKDRGVDVPYMLKENEGHGFSNEENKFDFYREMLNFLKKHIG